MEVLVVGVLEYDLVDECAGGGVVDKQGVLESLVSGQHQVGVVGGDDGVPQQPDRVLHAVQLNAVRDGAGSDLTGNGGSMGEYGG